MAFKISTCPYKGIAVSRHTRQWPLKLLLSEDTTANDLQDINLPIWNYCCLKTHPAMAFNISTRAHKTIAVWRHNRQWPSRYQPVHIKVLLSRRHTRQWPLKLLLSEDTTAYGLQVSTCPYKCIAVWRHTRQWPSRYRHAHIKLLLSENTPANGLQDIDLPI